MNSKNVLGKIMALLSMDKEEVLFTDAKTAEGTILQSPTFDLGEDVEVVSEDGTKTPAPDGEHEIALKDSEGKEVVIRIQTKDGKIIERANVEEESPEVGEETEMEDMPADVAMSDAGTQSDPTKGDTLNRKDINSVPGAKIADTKLAADYVKAPKGLETDEAKSLPNTTDEDPRNRVGTDTDDKKDPLIALSYRITELEDAIAELKAKFGEDKVEEVIDEVKDEEEVKVAKLDGAPVEMSAVNLSGIHKPTTNKVGNSQNSFLSKLYN
jgi:hypothetical protein